jgi:hypothetical protein
VAPHFGSNFAEYVNESYQGRWVRRGGPVAWPSRSPDLNALDFFIWSERSLCCSHNGLLNRNKAAAGRVQHGRNRCLRKKRNGRHSVETLNEVTRGGMLMPERCYMVLFIVLYVDNNKNEFRLNVYLLLKYTGP